MVAIYFNKIVKPTNHLLYDILQDIRIELIHKNSIIEKPVLRKNNWVNRFHSRSSSPVNSNLSLLELFESFRR
tara:strand:+ start:1211 stop:1429 length:219 start_codon:yes stop_codon:yes gene_type:complete